MPIPAKALIIASLTATFSSLFAQVDWTWCSPQPTGNTLNDAAWNGRVLVVIGENGQIATSTDDSTWTVRTSGTVEMLNDIVHGNNSFYIVGGRGVILVSEDGTAWTRLKSPSTRNLNGIAWMNDRAIAVGDSGTTVSILSNGQVLEGSVGVGMNLNSIAWNGKMLLATGQDSLVMVSADGTVWTNERSPSGTKGLSSVQCFDSLFYAHGIVSYRNGDISFPQGVCFRSKDGTAWDVIATLNGNDFQCLTMHNDTIISAVAGDIVQRVSTTEPKLLYTTNRLTSLNAIIKKGAGFAAVGWGGTILIARDLTSWRSVDACSNTHLRAITWTGKQVVAVGDSGTIITSTDGTRWQKRTSSTGCSFTDIIWTGDRLVAVGKRCILVSTDGSIWNPAFPDSIAADFHTIRWDGKKLLAGGVHSFVVVDSLSDMTINTTGVIFTSSDGTAWVRRPLPTPNPVVDIAWNEAMYSAITNNGFIFTSADGTTWNNTNTYVRTNYSDPATLLWNGSAFYAFGNNISSAMSVDGVDWWRLPVSLGEGTHIHSVVWSGREFVAVGAGRILTSPDANDWTVRFNPGGRNLNDIIFTGNRFFAVGEYGSVLTSSLDTSLRTAVLVTPQVTRLSEQKIRSTISEKCILTVSLPLFDKNVVADVSIYSPSGRCVAQKGCVVTAGSVTIPMSRFPAGWYLCKVSTNGKNVVSDRFILYR